MTLELKRKSGKMYKCIKQKWNDNENSIALS